MSSRESHGPPGGHCEADVLAGPVFKKGRDGALLKKNNKRAKQSAAASAQRVVIGDARSSRRVHPISDSGGSGQRV